MAQSARGALSWLSQYAHASPTEVYFLIDLVSSFVLMIRHTPSHPPKDGGIGLFIAAIGLPFLILGFLVLKARGTALCWQWSCGLIPETWRHPELVRGALFVWWALLTFVAVLR